MYKKILVPVDLNENGFSDRAVELAVWHAKQSNAELHLLNVLPGMHMSMVASYFPKDAARKMKLDVEKQLQQFAKQHISDDVVYKVHIAEGKAYKTILNYAEKLSADLIIMPSHRRSKIDKALLGSVTSKVVQAAPISVLVLKPQG
ncbi:universal stress protein [Vibrio sp. 404]|uniref:Universal stress protein n=1 Tax=Vibrio marinisediminis TaxID=2758441 RepID=A0A7W2FQ20_9VIBR|nr:universal stress protein [Vibrio marinisediminis]MBA5762125.1 universal stress protein [Vibrio marinisediminis]